MEDVFYIVPPANIAEILVKVLSSRYRYVKLFIYNKSVSAPTWGDTNTEKSGVCCIERVEDILAEL
jgi:hypothetical protein